MFIYTRKIKKKKIGTTLRNKVNLAQYGRDMIYLTYLLITVTKMFGENLQQ